MRLRLAAALCCALGVAATPAAAQVGPSEGDKAAAREAYQEGERLARDGRYADAARAFGRADALSPNDTALEAALEAALRGDDPALAMNLLERTRRTPSAAALPAASRVEAAFASRTAAIEIPCLDEQPPCSATIDGAAPVARRTWVLPGAHRVVLTAPDGRDQADPVDLAAGAVASVALRSPAEALPAPPPAPPRAAPSDEPGSEGGLSPWWFVGGASITAVLGGLTIGHGAAAASNKGDFDDAAEAGASRAELQALADDGVSLETRTNVFLVSTIVAGAATAGLALFAIDWGDDGDHARALVVPDGGGGARFVAAGSF